MNLAIIPARGGSKRIPRKNIKDFCGKPIIAYSIETAIKSGLFDKVIVSTDDEEIAEVARSYGAEVPFMRPKELADDYSTTTDVIQHAISRFIDAGLKINNVCCIYATAPFIQSKYLKKGRELIQQKGIEFAFSVTTYAFPIQRAIKLADDGSVSMFNPEYEQVRSQDLEEAYHDAGQFYWGSKSAFLNKKSIFSPHSQAVLIPRTSVQDIDNNDDWKFAEALFSLRKRS